MRWAFIYVVFASMTLASHQLGAAEPIAFAAEIKALRFTSDHQLLRQNRKDVLQGGERYPDVSWTRSPRTSCPITHTGRERVRAEITLSVAGIVDATPYFLEGISEEAGLCFRAVGRLSAGENIAVAVEAPRRLGKRVRKVRASISWLLTIRPDSETAETLFLGATGPHVIYVTLGTPRNTDEPRGVVTDIRMELAVRRMAAVMRETGVNASAPRLVHELMMQNGYHYLPTRHYPRDQVWKVPESWHMKPSGANCISIVEFTSLICDMIGIEGSVEVTAYYAKPPHVRRPLKGGLGEPPITKKGPNGATWQLFLIDEGNTNNGQIGGVGGVNYYEAVLVHEWQGQRFYFPGGTYRAYDSPEKVLHVFRTLAWTTYDHNLRSWVVREVEETYVRPGDKRPPDVDLPP